MKVVHGSNARIPAGCSFKPSSKGTLGSGIYFAGRASEAKEYGRFLHHCEVTLQRPWRVQLDPDSATCMAWDFECAALDAVLALENGVQLAEAAREDESGHFGRSLTETLIAMGYDGIVGSYGGSCIEVVAFDGRQVKVLKVEDVVASGDLTRMEANQSAEAAWTVGPGCV